MTVTLSSTSLNFSSLVKKFLYAMSRPDPNGILAFAVEQLQAAEDLGQRAWIIAHMPPGGPDVLHDQVCPVVFFVTALD